VTVFPKTVRVLHEGITSFGEPLRAVPQLAGTLCQPVAHDLCGIPAYAARETARARAEARITRSAWRSRSTLPDAEHRQRVVVLQLDASVTAEKRLALRPESIARVSSLFYDGRRLEADRWTLVCGNRERLLSIL
jgi:hypothetical protein